MPFEFKPNQAPSTLLPGEIPISPDGRQNELPNPLGSKAQARSAHNVRRAGEVISASRPSLNTEDSRTEDPSDRFFEAQMQRMVDKDYLLQPVDNYILKPGSHANILIGHNPVSAALVKDQEAIEQALGAEKNIKLRVLGTGFAARESGDIDKAIAGKDLLVACPGDLHSLSELCHVIEKKCSQYGRKKSQDASGTPPLIIENRDHFWDNTLIPTKLMRLDKDAPKREQRQYINLDALASHHGIYITESRDETLEVARRLAKEAAKKHTARVRPKAPPPPIVPEGSTIFVATSTKKKYDEMVDIYKAQGLNVKFRRIEYLLDGSFNSPKEDRFSYEGNAALKMAFAFQAWDRMSPENKAVRLKALGLTENRAFILTEDSGFHFDQPGLASEPEFAYLPKEIKKDQPFPGTETGPATIGSMGVESFFRKVNDIYDRRGKAQDRMLPRVVHQRAVIALAPLAGNSSEKLNNLYMMSAASDATFTREPFPKPDLNTSGVEMDNFLLPLHDNPRGLTEAQLGKGWLSAYSRRSNAWHALAYEAGIEKDKKHIPDFEKEFHAAMVVDDSHPSLKVAQELERRAKEDGFDLSRVKPDIKKLRDVQTNMLEGADGVVLAFDPEKAREDFWRNMWIVSSLVVGEQTRDKYKLGKPMYLVNPKDEAGQGAFSDLEKLIYDMHTLGTISQDPVTLLKSVGSIEAAVSGLKEDRKDYHRYDPPAYSKSKSTILEERGRPSDKPFSVAVFTSVTNENSELLGINEELTRRLIEAGIGIVSGAGLNAGMGTVTYTANKLGMDDRLDVHHTGVTVPHIEDKETSGKPVKDFLDHYLLTRDIYARIDNLLSADAVAITPGGMGTVQELAGFALLKKKALEHPELKSLQKFKNKEIVLLNTEVDVGGKKRGFYDLLIQIIPPDQLKSLGIHVMNSVDETVAKMIELRDRKLSDPAQRPLRKAGGHGMRNRGDGEQLRL